MSAWVQYLLKPNGCPFAYDAELDCALLPSRPSRSARRRLDDSKLLIVKAGDYACKAKAAVTPP